MECLPRGLGCWLVAAAAAHPNTHGAQKEGGGPSAKARAFSGEGFVPSHPCAHIGDARRRRGGRPGGLRSIDGRSMHAIVDRRHKQRQPPPLHRLKKKISDNNRVADTLVPLFFLARFLLHLLVMYKIHPQSQSATSQQHRRFLCRLLLLLLLRPPHPGQQSLHPTPFTPTTTILPNKQLRVEHLLKRPADQGRHVRDGDACDFVGIW